MPRNWKTYVCCSSNWKAASGPALSRISLQKRPRVDDLLRIAILVDNYAEEAQWVNHALSRPPLAEASIHGLDEHVCGPETGASAPTRIVVARGLRRLHLFNGHAFVLHVPDPVANNRDHVAIISNISRITKPAMAWNDIRSALFVARRDY